MITKVYETDLNKSGALRVFPWLPAGLKPSAVPTQYVERRQREASIPVGPLILYALFAMEKHNRSFGFKYVD